MNANLAPYQERVITEKAELEVRISKLSEFIKSGSRFLQVPEVDRVRLNHQLQVMTLYLNILNERINAFSWPAS